MQLATILRTNEFDITPGSYVKYTHIFKIVISKRGTYVRAPNRWILFTRGSRFLIPGLYTPFTRYKLIRILKYKYAVNCEY